MRESPLACGRRHATYIGFLVSFQQELDHSCMTPVVFRPAINADITLFDKVLDRFLA